jgi:hypothetical protein
MEKDEALVLLIQGGGGERLGLSCPLNNLMTLSLLVLDLPLRRCRLLLWLAFGLGMALPPVRGAAVVSAVRSTSMTSAAASFTDGQGVSMWRGWFHARLILSLRLDLRRQLDQNRSKVTNCALGAEDDLKVHTAQCTLYSGGILYLAFAGTRAYVVPGHA